MKGKIADSIIIKVGHGIMEIPRKTTQVVEPECSPENKTKAQYTTKQLSPSIQEAADIPRKRTDFQ